MKVKDIMAKDMVTVYPDTTLESACALMKNYDIGFLPVEQDSDFVGVITDRDIVIRAFAESADPEEEIKPYITNYLITIASDAPIEEALELMAEEKVKRLMVEENNKIVGLVSLSDLLNESKDHTVLEYVTTIFSPDEEVVITNEIDIPQAEVDEFEL